jgi:stearoyl-CoA desaturase (delta-9 desaturase)
MQTESITIRQGTRFNWSIALFMLIFHLGAVAALFMFSWSALAVAVFLWWVAGSLGIGLSYHRQLTHRGFKTSKPVEYFLALCGTLAFEGGPISWVATHRLHHAQTEKDQDPHSPRHGFWWSHMGWILNGRSLHRDTATTARYVPDLAKDRFYLWLTEWHFLSSIPLAAALYLLGGWPFVFWGIFLRVVFSWHATWFVNSAAHVWGGRRFETRDDSRNLWWVALMSHGEGWHNNHHAHPTSARHGLAWYELDVNWIGIRALEKLGLAHSIRVVSIDGVKAERGHRPSEGLRRAA